MNIVSYKKRMVRINRVTIAIVRDVQSLVRFADDVTLTNNRLRYSGSRGLSAFLRPRYSRLYWSFQPPIVRLCLDAASDARYQQDLGL